MIDIAILGAGLAGGGLAAALATLGWNVVLLERRALPHHKVCGEFLSPEAQSSLRALGLYDMVAALKPALMHQALLVSRLGIGLRLDLPGSAWGVSRFALDAALARVAAARGAQVRMGVNITAVQPTAGGWEVQGRGAQGERLSLTARAVVAAYGRRPPPGLRPSDPGTPIEQTYVGVKAHVAGLDLPPEVQLYLFAGGYVGLSPIEDGRSNLALLATRDAFARAGADPYEMIMAVVRGSPRLARQLADAAIIPDSVVSVAPVDTERRATPWEGYARIGDAAVMIPPLCGDGMAMALRAAEVTAPLAHDFLRGRLTLAAWEQSYRAAWAREFDRPVRVGRRLQALLGRPGLGDGLLALGNLLPGQAARLVRGTRVAEFSPAF